jgi:glycosyltransferase involved in cell wall biosynthesis
LTPFDRHPSNNAPGGPAPDAEGSLDLEALPFPVQEVLSRSAFIIPVYNHAGAVAGVIEKTKAFRRPVIAVDDGSTDDTPRVLESLRDITVIRHAVNRGKGAALLTGFAAARPLADWAVTLDADGRHDPADALSLMKAVAAGERPLVVGRRAQMLEKGAPWTSRWGRGFSNFWVWACSGLILLDTQSGFRLYPLPETLALQPRGRRFQFEVEVLVLAAWSGMPVSQADVSTRYRLPGERISHFQPGPDFWRNTCAFSRLLAMRLLLPRNRRLPK